MKTWNDIPSNAIIQETAKSLIENGMKTTVVETKEQARAVALSLLPKNAEVMDMTSVTLAELGIQAAIHGSGFKKAVKQTLGKLTDPREKRHLGAAPEFAIGSVHAITQDGHVFIASNTGSQLAAYVYGAGQVIWVVGAQKIVKHADDAMKRIYEHSLPLEAERARQAYGAAGSNVSKILIIQKEVKLDRIQIILIKEQIGF